MRRITASFCALSLVVLSQAADFRIKDGDRVLFYGDSITEQHLYTNFIETFIVTRFPNLKVTFRNTGVGGDRVTGGWAGPIDLRLKRDFIDHKPTVATIMLGMNDASYQAFNRGIFDTYTKGYQKIVADIQKNLPTCKLFLIQPSPFDDVAHKTNWEPGYNSVLATYGTFVKGLAIKAGYEAIDLNAPLVKNLENAVKIDAVLATKLVEDRVHPGGPFQLLMASQILKAWNAPAIVTDVEIDLSARKVIRSQNSMVKLGKETEWTQLDTCLPFPLDMKDEVARLALQSSDFIEKLNRQMLTVSGLTGRRYELLIDGTAVGQFTKNELQKGINLAILDTPMVKQALVVQDFTNRHNTVFMRRWRQVQMDLAAEPKLDKAIAALDAMEAEVVKLQHAAAKPVIHRYHLRQLN